MLGYRPLVLEKRSCLGGLQLDSPYTNNWIVGMPGLRGHEVAKAMHDHVVAAQIAYRLSCDVTDVKKAEKGFCATFDEAGTTQTVTSRCVVVASGVRAATGGFKATRDFLIGPGAQIATRDYKGRSVAILGGGDNAFENYLFVKKNGARRVRIFARNIRARQAFLALVPPDHVIVGEAVIKSSRNQVNGETFDAIIVLYGWTTHTPFLARLKPARDPNGFILTDEHCETSVTGVFAIGEVAHRMHPCCVTAMADGVVAAKAIQRRLEQGSVARFLGMTRRAVGALKKRD